MGRGHGGTGNSVGGEVGSNPGGGDAAARGKDVEDGAEVTVRSTGICDVDSTHGDGGGGRSRGEVCGVLVGVTRCHNEWNAITDPIINCGIEGSRVATSQTHVGNTAPNSALGPGVVDNPLDTSNDTRDGTRAIGTEDLDTSKQGELSNTNSSATNCASDVCSVPITLQHARKNYLLAHCTYVFN